MEVSDQLNAGCSGLGWRAHSIQWAEGWVCPRSGLDCLQKQKVHYPCQESNCDCLVVKPVA